MSPQVTENAGISQTVSKPTDRRSHVCGHLKYRPLTAVYKCRFSRSHTKVMSFQELGTHHSSTATKHLTVTEKSKSVPIPHIERKYYLLWSPHLFCFDLIFWFFSKYYRDIKAKNEELLTDQLQQNRDCRRNLWRSHNFLNIKARGKKLHSSVK